MKQMIRKLTAITAAAITAASMTATGNLTTSAYSVTDNPNAERGYYRNLQNYNTRYRGYWWETASQQVNMPVFDRNFNPNGKYLIFKNAENYHVVGTLLRKSGNNKGFSLDNNDDLMDLKMYVDAMLCQNGRYQDQTLDLIYSESSNPNNNEFGLRMYDPTHYYLKSLLNQIKLEDFSVNNNTGAYSGKLRLYDNYISGMQVWYAEGTNDYNPNNTTFYATNLKKYVEDDDYYNICSEISFSGKLPFKPNTLYFSSAQSKTILNDIKITYNSSNVDEPETYYTTNNFMKTYTKNTNGLYTGYLDGNTLHTEISGQAKTNFNNNKFVCAKASGNTLYIYIGKNNSVADSRWNTAWGETKLNAFLNSTGWKDGFAHNTWVVNWLNSHNNSNCTVKFMYDCTTSYTGNMFYNCTASYFRNTKLGLR
ncbi:MAG: hypothetical protein J5722_12585 [Oscillospiraceae bacterium]|nr:hypothetical protein [Oscillospiraceae bacterium]